MNLIIIPQSRTILKYLFLLTILLAISSIDIYAKLYDFKVEGIAYAIKDIDNMEVFVANDNEDSEINPRYAIGYKIEESSYQGDVEIPKEIEFGEFRFKVTGIDIGAFFGCSEMTAIELPESIKETRGYAFYGCSSIKSINLPHELHKIGQADYYDCSLLSEIIMYEKIDTIASGAFTGCENLEVINLSSSLKCIENGAFSYSGIKRIEIPEGMTFLGTRHETAQDGGPFSKCDNLETIVLPKSLTGIVNWAFSSSPKLKTIVCQNPQFPSCGKYENMDYIFYGDNIHYILAPIDASDDYATWPGMVITYPDNDNVSELGKSVIYDDLQYTIVNGQSEYNVYLDSSVNDEDSIYIYDEFDQNNAHYNTIGIYKRAFENNTNLRNVYVHHTNPISIDDSTFDKMTYLLGKLYVPYGRKDIYKNAIGWRNFKTIEEFDATAIHELKTDVSKYGEYQIYNPNGQRIDERYEGIAIVRFSDGSTKKIIKCN